MVDRRQGNRAEAGIDSVVTSHYGNIRRNAQFALEHGVHDPERYHIIHADDCRKVLVLPQQFLRQIIAHLVLRIHARDHLVEVLIRRFDDHAVAVSCLLKLAHKALHAFQALALFGSQRR